jgi:hypothetical protein
MRRAPQTDGGMIMFWKKASPQNPVALREQFVSRLDSLLSDYEKEVGDYQISDILESRARAFRLRIVTTSPIY